MAEPQKLQMVGGRVPAPQPAKPKQVVAGMPIDEILVADVPIVLHAHSVTGESLGNAFPVPAGGMVLILPPETAEQLRATLGIGGPTIIRPS